MSTSMKNAPSLLQSKIVTVFKTIKFSENECKGIYNMYWKTDVSTVLGSYTDSDAVTVATKITKGELVSGLTLCENLNNFFTNSSVTTADYLQTMLNILNGNDEASAIVSTSVENIGNRLYHLFNSLNYSYDVAKEALNIYIDNEMGDVLAVIDSDRHIWGSDMNKQDLSVAITLIEQFKNFVENSAVTTGDYSSTVSKWQVYL